jgi:hypothetical protein
MAECTQILLSKTAQRYVTMKMAIALISLITTAATAIAAPTRVTVDGQDWVVDTISGTYAEHAELLSTQPWFGHRALARKFLIAAKGYRVDAPPTNYWWGDFPNVGSNVSPYFVYFDTRNTEGEMVAMGVSRSETTGDISCILWENCDVSPRDLTGVGADGVVQCGGPFEPCVWAIATPPTDFHVLPADGNYSLDGTFDFVLVNVSSAIIGGSIILDGTDITTTFDGCWTAPSPTSFACNGIDWAAVGSGTHTMETYLDLANGEQVSQIVTWTVNL